MQDDGDQHQTHIVQKVAPVARNGGHDETDQRQKADDAQRLFEALGPDRKKADAQQAQHKGQADDEQYVRKHLRRVQGDVGQQLGACGVHAAPKREVQRHGHHRDGIGHRGHRHAQRHIALGPVREDVAHIAGRAAGDEDHAQCDAGRRL